MQNESHHYFDKVPQNSGGFPTLLYQIQFMYSLLCMTASHLL